LGRISGIAVGLVLAAGTLAACGSDAPLADLGHMTERWIAAAPDAPITTSPPPAAAPLGLLATNGAETVEWVNDELGNGPPAVSPSPDEIVNFVWSRSNGQDRYVQASRIEILAALPALEVPLLIPDKVSFITSQLIFDPATGELASDAAAAFGFWSEKPYTKSRTVSQLAVLMVAIEEPPPAPVVPDTIGVPAPEPVGDRCERLTDAAVRDCTRVTLQDGCPAWSLEVTDGWRLVWSEHSYTYDLFVRNAADADLLTRMAGSCEGLAPGVSVLAGAEGPEGEPAESESNPAPQATDS
jgi:hypothetical protein